MSDDKEQQPLGAHKPAPAALEEVFAKELTDDPDEKPFFPDIQTPAESDPAPQLAPTRARAFWTRTGAVAKSLANRWFITAFGGMALGLFATLIAGTIVRQVGDWLAGNAVGSVLYAVGQAAIVLMGAGIGAGIARSLKMDRLVLFASMLAGFIGAQTGAIMSFMDSPNDVVNGVLKWHTLAFTGPGEPISAFISAVIACEVCELIRGKTKVDIVVLPVTAIVIGLLCVISINRPIAWALLQVGEAINATTAANPVVMGMVVSLVTGLLLTLPTSSAAICIAAGIGGPAGAAAAVGGAAHMVGFAAMSFKENRVGGLVAQGLGTSMLQIPNLMRNPRILIPPSIASLITGPLAVAAFGFVCPPAGAGMGTAGLVGVFLTITESLAAGVGTAKMIVGVLLLFFVIPAAVSLPLRWVLEHFGWIKEGDLKLQL
ncbi:MAG: PTS sugar transporter subunit IIC [Clostridiales bacterium]|jgi:uncharacterized membrane protein|nr:PTS sugar transporter subunit IIC [Clostridiales bacterium]